MVIDIKSLDQKLNEKFEAIDDIVNKLNKNNHFVEEAKNTFQTLNKKLKELETENNNLILKIKNDIDKYDKKIKIFEASFIPMFEKLKKDFSDLNKLTKTFSIRMQDLEKQIELSNQLIKKLEDFQTNTELQLKKLDLYFSELKRQVIFIDEKVTILVEENNKSFFRRLFKKKLVFD